jgi:hypothetical protein
MQKFYVLEISTGDERIQGRAVYEYNTLNEAVATFHQKLATAMKSDLYSSELVMVIDDTGAVFKTEKYIKPIEVEEVTEEA